MSTTSELLPAPGNEVELKVPTREEVIVNEEVSPEVNAAADQFVTQLLSMDPRDVEASKKLKGRIDQMGEGARRKFSRRGNKLLDNPVVKLASGKDKGGQTVHDQMIELSVKASELNPSKFKINNGPLVRMFGAIPFLGISMQRYLTRFSSGHEVIKGIVADLKGGRDQLVRDNKILGEEKAFMRQITYNLTDNIKLARILLARLNAEVEKLEEGDEKRQFLETEIIFTLQQKVQDLQQELVVYQQGYVVSDMTMKSNVELIRGINRNINVLEPALRIGFQLSMALMNQKKALEATKATSEVTSQILLDNAQKLDEQGMEIQKLASEPVLALETMQKAYAHIDSALAKYETYRQDAIPVMREQIEALHEMTAKAETTIQKMEKGDQMRPEVEELLSLDDAA